MNDGVQRGPTPMDLVEHIEQNTFQMISFHNSAKIVDDNIPGQTYPMHRLTACHPGKSVHGGFAHGHHAPHTAHPGKSNHIIIDAL